MRHQAKGRQLSRTAEHRRALLSTMATSLFLHGKVVTTEAKAKAIRSAAEHMITLAKREHLHARRQVLAMVPDTEVVHRLFDTVAARFSERHGGYTRIIKAGPRPGDAAPMVLLELVDRVEVTDGKGKDKDGKRSKKAERDDSAAGSSGRRRRREKAAAASG